VRTCRGETLGFRGPPDKRRRGRRCERTVDPGTRSKRRERIRGSRNASFGGGGAVGVGGERRGKAQVQRAKRKSGERAGRGSGADVSAVARSRGERGG
jgi:hypothetical protein